jgi:2'-hydroxyisoflavone reductase
MECSMKLLVIGGTAFVGRHVVHAARAAGMEVTLFNRGTTSPALFTDLERIHGDRATDLDLLADRRWDAVVDTCGYLPRVVGASARALRVATHTYAFISTVSVYADLGEPSSDEGALLHPPERDTQEVTGETYGPLKVACEEEVRDAWGDDALVIRPGVVAGPHDPTDRFTYWTLRPSAGGEILGPGSALRTLQVIDARDLGDWVVRALLAGVTGTFDAVGPTVTFDAVLAAAGAHTDTTVTWVDDAFLVEHGVRPWADLPLWLPPDVQPGMSSVRADRAVDAGLTFRSLTDTVSATQGWAGTRAGHVLTAGMTRKREQELLAAWHARGGFARSPRGH